MSLSLTFTGTSSEVLFYWDKYIIPRTCTMAKSANKGKKGSPGGQKNSKQNQGNATANKAKNGGKKR